MAPPPLPGLVSASLSLEFLFVENEGPFFVVAVSSLLLLELFMVGIVLSCVFSSKHARGDDQLCAAATPFPLVDSVTF